MLHKFTFRNGQVHYISRHTAEGVIRRAKKEGFLSVTMFGLNANTPLKDAQDPCSALLGAQVSRNGFWRSIGYDAKNLLSSNPCGSQQGISSQMRGTSM
jgi:hypothetical protein